MLSMFFELMASLLQIVVEKKRMRVNKIFKGTPMLQITIFVLVYVHFYYFSALILRNFGVMDIAWGSGFILVAVVSYFQAPLGMKNALLLLTTAIWGIRLSLHIIRRNIGAPEDPRYAELRRDWGRHANREAYFKIFLFQGILLLLVSLPVSQGMGTDMRPWNWIGLFIWLVGFTFESYADAFLKRYKADPANKGKICMSGPWTLCRFPNYFGEILLWYGVWLLALTSANAWTLLGPVLLNILILKLTGIPMLEKKYRQRPEYLNYSSRVPRLVPFTRPRRLTCEEGQV